MLRSKLLLFLAFSSSLALAQGTLYNAITYQAVARDANGAPLPNQAIGLQFDLTAGPGLVYRETQSVTTNDQGLFKAEIGTGTPAGYGPLEDYRWYHPSNNMFIFVHADFTGGTNYQLLGQEPIRAVPVANSARMATTLLDSSLVVDIDSKLLVVDPDYALTSGTSANDTVVVVADHLRVDPLASAADGLVYADDDGLLRKSTGCPDGYTSVTLIGGWTRMCVKAQAADFYYPSSDGCIQSGGELCDLKQVQRLAASGYTFGTPTGWLSDIDADDSFFTRNSSSYGLGFPPNGNMSGPPQNATTVQLSSHCCLEVPMR